VVSDTINLNSALYIKLVSARTFPLYRQKVPTRFFAAMPIRAYLQGHRFNAEAVRVLGIAFEMAIVALQQGDGIVSPTREAVAQKIIELAKAGERDPERSLVKGRLSPAE
jgi:hypothetical protein